MTALSKLKPKRPRGDRQKGSALIEFALCLALFWLPLFLGTYQIGFNLIRSVQVTQICRDAGHMYSMGTDFSQTANQNLLMSLMPSSISTTSGGNSVIYMSTVTYVDASACTSGGLSANTSSCPNLGQAVFARQIPLGNTSLKSSYFGTPACPSSNSYNCTQSYQLTNSGAIATGFLNVIPLTSSTQFAYMAEMYVYSSDLTFFSSLGPDSEYARSIF